jgi:CRISPR-associated protein Cas6/Cse3/CasE subtype I-E
MAHREQLIAVAGAPSLYQLHQLVYARFAQGGRRDFLYAPLQLPHTLAVLVRGPFDGQALPSLAAGDEAAFSLRALVTVKSREDNRRRPLGRGRTAERLAWLARRGGEHGFEVLQADVTVERRPFDKPGRTAWLDVSEFNGRLRVTDAEKFAAALDGGIGKGRAFGFGMLVLYGGDE